MKHLYVSTWCMHDHHEECDSPVGLDADGREFSRRPGQCKLCAAQCRCPCHDDKALQVSRPGAP